MPHQRIVKFENVSQFPKSFLLEVDSIEELYSQLEVIYPVLEQRREFIKVLISPTKEGTMNRTFLKEGKIPENIEDLYIKLQRKRTF